MNERNVFVAVKINFWCRSLFWFASASRIVAYAKK
jgi:hypothetical protein